MNLDMEWGEMSVPICELGYKAIALLLYFMHLLFCVGLMFEFQVVVL